MCAPIDKVYQKGVSEKVRLPQAARADFRAYELKFKALYWAFYRCDDSQRLLLLAAAHRFSALRLIL
jgi:hypothetical protein